MARTTKEIQHAIADKLAADRPDLSASAVAEWRLWTYIVAVAIHTFEVILDAFRKEVEQAADKITPGTVRWYVEQAYRFQNGHRLLYDENTAQVYYEEDDPGARIIAVVAVIESNNILFFKVAKLDDQDKITELDPDELHNFTDYIESIKFAGIRTEIISTHADEIRYRLQVYYDPAYPRTAVEQNVLDALSQYRTSLNFNSLFYRQRFTEAVTATEGVVTAELAALERKGTSMADFAPVAVVEELESGYFDYTEDSVLELYSIKSGEV